MSVIPSTELLLEQEYSSETSTGRHNSLFTVVLVDTTSHAPTSLLSASRRLTLVYVVATERPQWSTQQRRAVNEAIIQTYEASRPPPTDVSLTETV